MVIIVVNFVLLFFSFSKRKEQQNLYGIPLLNFTCVLFVHGQTGTSDSGQAANLQYINQSFCTENFQQIRSLMVINSCRERY